MMRYIVITFAVLMSPLVSAVDQFSISELGPLFTTAKERQQMDRRRSGRAPKASQEVRHNTSNVTVNGIVKRSDGKSTVWVNGRSDADLRTRDGIKVSKRHSRGDSVAVYVDGRMVRIKPGETWSDKGVEDQSGN